VELEGGAKNFMATNTKQVEDSVEAVAGKNVEVLGSEDIADFIDYISFDT
jgi:hypothetical protein